MFSVMASRLACAASTSEDVNRPSACVRQPTNIRFTAYTELWGGINQKCTWPSTSYVESGPCSNNSFSDQRFVCLVSWNLKLVFLLYTHHWVFWVEKSESFSFKKKKKREIFQRSQEPEEGSYVCWLPDLTPIELMEQLLWENLREQNHLRNYQCK